MTSSADFEKQLNDKERKILKDRLLAEEPKTLQEVADLYGLTRERARQIEAKVIQKLRERLAGLASMRPIILINLSTLRPQKFNLYSPLPPC